MRQGTNFLEFVCSQLQRIVENACWITKTKLGGGDKITSKPLLRFIAVSAQFKLLFLRVGSFKI